MYVQLAYMSVSVRTGRESCTDITVLVYTALGLQLYNATTSTCKYLVR